MAAIKAYSDLQQSKKLAEILPLESADMYWDYDVQKHEDYPMVMDEQFDDTCIRAWSLTALLSALPFHLIVNNRRYAFSMIKGFNKNGETYAIKYYATFNSAFYYHMTDFYNSPIDAAFEMVCWLKENEKL